ncbi:MAG: type IV pili twitching motility protein PilT, partial [Burkholderiales bacterium]
MFIDPLLKLMAEKNASDLFISAGAPISIKILDSIMPVNQTVIDGNLTQKIADELMDERQSQAFEQDWEMNFSHVMPEVGRFRV